MTTDHRHDSVDTAQAVQTLPPDVAQVREAVAAASAALRGRLHLLGDLHGQVLVLAIDAACAALEDTAWKALDVALRAALDRDAQHRQAVAQAEHAGRLDLALHEATRALSELREADSQPAGCDDTGLVVDWLNCDYGRPAARPRALSRWWRAVLGG